MIEESTAAAMCYGLMNKNECDLCEKLALVFDLGAGAFNNTVLQIKDGQYNTLSTSGDATLGGVDFDNILINYCLLDIENRFFEDVRKNPKAMRKLKHECELAKKALSQDKEFQIECVLLTSSLDYYLTVTRVQLEELYVPLVNKCLDLVEDSLKKAKLKKGEIDEIIMVGEMTKMPLIQCMVSEFFDGKRLNNKIAPDEAVAAGASI